MESKFMGFVETNIFNVSFNVINSLGIISVFILSLMMFVNGLVHRRAMKKKNKAILDEYPKISLILPCKGILHNSREVWDSQIQSTYKGEMELIFVTETKKDPAYNEIAKLLEKTNYKNRKTLLVDAGISWHNSQKVHNMLAGIQHVSEDSKYIFFLDNDIIVNGAAFNNIIRCIDQDKRTQCSTGYSIEIPDIGGSFASYLVVAFRSIQLLGFSREKIDFIWGGCYMMRREYIFNNVDHYMDMLKDGTYSEDMVLASILTRKKKAISSSKTALFPNVLPKDYKFKSYLEYLRRQYFVLCTYQSKYHLMNNIVQVTSMGLSFMIFGVPVICWLIQFFTLIPYLILKGLGYYSNKEWNGVSYIINVCLVIGFILMVFAFGFCISFCIHSMDKMSAALSNEKYHKAPNPLKMSFAMMLHLMIMPFVAVIAPSLRNVVWCGVKYISRGGRICKMYRPDEKGNFTVTGNSHETMCKELKNDIRSGISIFDSQLEPLQKGQKFSSISDELFSST